MIQCLYNSKYIKMFFVDFIVYHTCYGLHLENLAVLYRVIYARPASISSTAFFIRRASLCILDGVWHWCKYLSTFNTFNTLVIQLTPYLSLYYYSDTARWSHKENSLHMSRATRLQVSRCVLL